MSLLNDVKAKLQEKKVEYTIAVLAALSMLLFGVIWWGWLYGLLARTGAAIPRRVLGAIIGVLAIWLIASLVLTVLYARALKAVKAENKSLAKLPSQLEKAQTDNRTLTAELNSIEAQRNSASLELQQALAHLHSFSENLPNNTDIKEQFVTEYHNILTRIEKESEQDLTTFRVSPNEVRYHETRHPASRRIGRDPFSPAHVTYSQHRYCDRAVFLTRLHGLIKYLADL